MDSLDGSEQGWEVNSKGGVPEPSNRAHSPDGDGAEIKDFYRIQAGESDQGPG